MVLGTMMVRGCTFCQLPRIIVVVMVVVKNALGLIDRNLTKCFCAGF